MKRSSVAALIMVVVACTATAEIPPVLKAPPSELQVPDWVAVEVAAPDGQVRAEWLPELGVQNLGRMIRTARSTRSSRTENPLKLPEPQASTDVPSCDFFKRRVSEYFVLEPSMEQVIDHSSAAIVGRMEESRTGFYRGELAVLWRVSVEQVIKWPGHTPPGQIYVIYGQARVELEGLQVCSSITGTTAPAISGQEIFVATHAKLGSLGFPIMNDGTPLVIPMPEEVLVEQPDGSAVWGSRQVVWSDTMAALDHISTDLRGTVTDAP